MPRASFEVTDFCSLTEKRHSVFGPARSPSECQTVTAQWGRWLQASRGRSHRHGGRSPVLAPEHPLPTPQGDSCTRLPPGTLFGPHPFSPDSTTTTPDVRPGLFPFVLLNLRIPLKRSHLIRSTKNLLFKGA